jgi:hypothetical protein
MRYRLHRIARDHQSQSPTYVVRGGTIGVVLGQQHLLVLRKLVQQPGPLMPAGVAVELEHRPAEEHAAAPRRVTSAHRGDPDVARASGPHRATDGPVDAVAEAPASGMPLP